MVSSTILRRYKFRNQDYVFTGHFHKRQIKKNVCYIGNAMPFDFNDENDSDRGIMLLQHGKEPIFREWPGQPLYRNVKLSDLLADPDAILRPHMTAQVTVDIVLRQEEIKEVRDAQACLQPQTSRHHQPA